MATTTARAALLIAAIVAISASFGCGDTPTSPTSFTRTATAPGLGLVSLPIDIVGNGTMTLTLTWTDGNKNLKLFLSAGGCSSCCVVVATQPGTCAALDQSDLSSGTREEITRAVRQNEKFIAWVSNPSTAPESVTLTASVRR